MDLHVDPDSAAGRRRGLEEALRAAVRAGRLPGGTRLPSTRALAAELGLSRGTVSAAYDQLVAEGYLTTRPGAATEVADVPEVASGPVSAPPADARPRHDLRPGRPDVSAFPARAWLRATRHVLATAPAEVFGLCDPRGRIELRTALAAYLGRTRGVIAAPERIVVVTGFGQAINLLATVIGGPVALEDPGHDFYREVVRRTGLDVVPLPVDDRGARTELLGADVLAAIVTPAHQYPLGVPLHPRRRRALRDWAVRGGLVIEDDYDGEFRYDRRPVGAFQGTAPEHVVYFGTTSETLAPALRLAWLVLPDALIGPIAEAKLYADTHTEVLGQLVLARLIETHDYDRHVRAARLKYRRRRELLVERLSRVPGLALPGVAAGLRSLVLLPADGPAEPDVLARCESAGIALRGARGLWHGSGPPGLLVGYAAARETAYPRAVEALAQVLTCPRRRRT
ncbi:MocR-like pyridoxine biosynthesis transcription factor PdxR [Nonomuraea antri]|uniref:MocR-like pyridoxine biosynthesis transcription factor PdxR n=1 Tax=Nonomuraea antri TaxID=2730852 RepID=UPI002E2C68D4|nr:PLP-dependent aminotransferase family protein [Nonomuraea antri]